MQENIFELLEVFEKQNHSGYSAPHTIKLFSLLASYKPLVPLTGEDSEWIEVGDGIFQNIRASNVFKLHRQPFMLKWTQNGNGLVETHHKYLPQ